MEIKINNLGAIKEANIDLSKRLIVFCGPNNSGKTYAAFIIYALTKSGLKYFRSHSHPPWRAFVKRAHFPLAFAMRPLITLPPNSKILYF